MQVIAKGAHEFLSKWDLSSDELTNAITFAVARSQLARSKLSSITSAAVDV
jgi:predicted transcriptional regulator